MIVWLFGTTVGDAEVHQGAGSRRSQLARVVTAASTLPGEPSARRIPGETGTWVFLFGDMLVFGVFFVTFMVERAKAPELFDVARTTLHIGVGVHQHPGAAHQFAVCRGRLRRDPRRRESHCDPRCLRRHRVRSALHRPQGVRVRRAGHRGHGPGANDFFLYYFILTGLHLFHVCLGIGALAFVLTQTRRPELSATRIALVEGGACFWHLVDLLWIFLFALLYLVS